MSSNPRIAIVGGGLSGLTAAHYLSQKGFTPTVIEAAPRLGGILQTEKIGDCLVEGGADSWLASKPWAAELVRDLGLGGEIIGSNDHARRTWVWRGDRLVEFPEGMQLVVPTRWGAVWRSELIGSGTKLRMVQDWFRRGAGPKPERSVAAMVREHFGQEAVDYIAEPLLSGIYGGDPEDLSATSVLPRFVERETLQGSLVRGAAIPPSKEPVFQTLRGGLGTLIDALAKNQPVVRGTVRQIVRLKDGYRLRLDEDWIEADRVIVACESHRAAEILDPQLSSLLQPIPHSSASIVVLAFRANEVRHPLNGFGFLIPKVEGRRMMACTWVTTKWPGRAPANTVLLRCFFNSGASVETARSELRVIMGITAEPLFARQYDWPRSLAQYQIGHQQRIAELEAKLLSWPGLKLIGNAYHGVGIPDCIRLAKQATS